MGIFEQYTWECCGPGWGVGSSLVVRQGITLSLLILSYSAVSLCMAALSVSTPMIMKELSFTATDIGVILAVGAFARVIPKLTSGMVVDYVGAKPMLVFSLTLTAILQTLSSYGSHQWYLTTIWAITRIAMCWVWPSAVRVVAFWFADDNIGTAMAVLSQAFYLGDAVSRAYLSSLLALGLDWREVFQASAATTFGVALAIYFFLRTEPPELILYLPPTPARTTGSTEVTPLLPSAVVGGTPRRARSSHPDLESWATPTRTTSESKPNTPADELQPQRRLSTEDNEQPPLSSVLVQLSHSGFFWSALVWCSFNNLIDQVFLDWTPNVLQSSLGISSALAGYTSMAFAVGGALSALFLGLVTDHYSMNLAMKAVLTILALGVAILLGMAYIIVSVQNQLVLPAALSYSLFTLVFAAGFTLYGPYSLTTALIPVRFAGKKTAATVGALLDGIATLVSTASGVGFGPLAQALGWGYAFAVLALVAVANWLGAFWHDRVTQTDTAKLK